MRTLADQAQAVDVTENQLRYWVRLGIVGCQRDGRYLMFDPDDARWLEAVANLVKLGVRPEAIASAMDRGSTMGWLRTLSAAAEVMAEIHSGALTRSRINVRCHKLGVVSEEAS